MNRRAVLIAMSAAVVLVIGMQAAINLAVPRIAAGALHPSPSERVWVVDAYVIVFASLLISGGAIGDRYGHRGAVLSGLGLFALGCAICALAPSVGVMLAGRAITGVGAALALPNTLAVLVGVFPPQERAGAIAVWAGMTGVGGVVGNIGAGTMLQLTSVAGMFWAFAALALVCIGLAAVSTPPLPTHDHAQDPVGSLLLIAGLVALIDGIIEGPEHGWGSARVLGAFVAAAVLLALFVVWELKRDQPLLDPRVFKIPGLRLAALLIALLFVGMFGFFYVNAQFLEVVKGYTPLQTGFAIAPMALTMVLVSRFSVRVVERLGARTTISIGLAVSGAGLLGFSFSTQSTPYLDYILGPIALAAGLGLSLPALSNAIIGALPARLAGLGSGLNGATRELGSALGVAIVGTILNAHLQHGHSTAEFTAGTSAGIRVVAVATLAAAVLAAKTSGAFAPRRLATDP